MTCTVALTAVDAQPNECALSAPLRVTVRLAPLPPRVRRSCSRAPQWEFTTSEALPGAAWEVTYVVDVAEHRRELPLGRTPRTDYAAGACAAEFSCDAIDVADVPQGYVRRSFRASLRRVLKLPPALCSWLNNIGLLKLALRDADDAQVFVSSLLTQIVRARPRLLRFTCCTLCASLARRILWAARALTRASRRRRTRPTASHGVL